MPACKHHHKQVRLLYNNSNVHCPRLGFLFRQFLFSKSLASLHMTNGSATFTVYKFWTGWHSLLRLNILHRSPFYRALRVLPDTTDLHSSKNTTFNVILLTCVLICGFFRSSDPSITHVIFFLNQSLSLFSSSFAQICSRSRWTSFILGHESICFRGDSPFRNAASLGGGS